MYALPGLFHHCRSRFPISFKIAVEKSEAVRAKVEARYFEGGARIGAAPLVDLEELNKPKKKNFGGANIRGRHECQEAKGENAIS